MVWKMGSESAISTMGRSGNTFFMLAVKVSPFDVAMEIVAHEKAAAEQEFAQGGGLRIGQVPVADFDAVEPGPVVNVAVVQVDGLFGRAGVEAREAADGLDQVTVRAGVIHGPVGGALLPAPVELYAAVIRAHGRIHQAGEDPLGFFLVVRGQRKLLVLHAGIFAEGLLKRIQHAQKQQAGGYDGPRSPEVGWLQHR